MAAGLAGLRGSVTAKLAVIGAILLTMLIPLSMTEALIRERSGERAVAEADIARAWGGAQTIGGPIVIIPLLRARPDRQGVTRHFEDELYILPIELEIEGDADMQVLNRGIFQIPVYTASLSVTGRLRSFDLSSLDATEVRWDEAVIGVPVADPRSIDNRAAIRFGGRSLTFDGSESVAGFGPMLKTSLADVDPAVFLSEQDFSLSLTLAGTGRLDFRPDGDTTTASLSSDWPSPSFSGTYLPDDRQVADTGFDATWRVLAAGRGYPSEWRESDSSNAGSIAQGADFAARRYGRNAGFGTEFILPVNVHSSSLRAIKYAQLYLAVTFAAFFLFEIFAGIRLHPVQYLSVGLANGIFYLLLLALAEHAGFGLAYAASATGSTALVGGYAAAVLRSSVRAAPIVGLLGSLYLFLYTTLRAEDYALMTGAVGLFVLLSGFMYLTRRVDWYAIELSGASVPSAESGPNGR